MDDDVTLVRIYINETDRGRKKLLMEEILDILHDQCATHRAVVFRGIAGFDSGGDVRCADMLRLAVDLPLVVEFFDKPAVVATAIVLLSSLVPARHIVQWRVKC
jgi:uncharacterized protein